MRCFGHRGAKGHVLENTMASFRKASELGASWVELDVQLVQGQLYVFHDETLERLAGRPERLLDLQTEEISRIRLEGGHCIPTLGEVMDAFRGILKINVELKGQEGAPELAAFLQDKISAGWHPEDLIVSSFNIRALKAFSALSPKIPIGLLYYGLPATFADDIAGTQARSVHLALAYCSSDIVAEIHALHCAVYVYTVNTKQEIGRMRAYEADGVFSDYPDRVAGY